MTTTSPPQRMIKGDRRMRVCIVGASGKLGRYMVEHALDRGYEVVAVCREQSVGKLAEFEDRISIVPGATDDDEVIKRAVAGCDGVLVVLVPRGVHGYSTGTAQAVLDHAEPGARLVFSCGWHITRDGLDVYSWKLKALVKVGGGLARLARFADLDDQVEACRRIFASDTRWTVVRGSDLEADESQGLPVWSHHVGDPILASNITRRVDFALFMVDALDNDDLVHEAPGEPASAWRGRWDSLRLFTSVRYDSLPGFDFPGDPDSYPGRDDVIAYLTDYAQRFELPVEFNSRVQAVRARDGGGFLVELADRTYEADQVVVATGPFQVPFTPPIAAGLGPELVQLHSARYRAPADLPPGTVLVVGGGNTGYQIAAELTQSREVHLAVGARQTPLPQRILGRDLFGYLEATGLMRKTV